MEKEARSEMNHKRTSTRTAKPIDKNIGKTLVGYVRGYDLNTLYSEAMPVFQKQQKATLYGEVAYEVQVKIVRRV